MIGLIPGTFCGGKHFIWKATTVLSITVLRRKHCSISFRPVLLPPSAGIYYALQDKLMFLCLKLLMTSDKNYMYLSSWKSSSSLLGPSGFQEIISSFKQFNLQFRGGKQSSLKRLTCSDSGLKRVMLGLSVIGLTILFCKL